MNVFIDSNIFIYSITSTDELKASISFNLLDSNRRNISISSQVINEVGFNLIRKFSFSEDKVVSFLSSMADLYKVTQISKETHIIASSLRSKYKVSYWDSLILATALESKSEIVYSEDMQHNLKVEEKLEIINPFA